MDVLSSKVIEALRICGESDKIDISTFEKLSEECIKCILLPDKEDIKQYPSKELQRAIEENILKQSFPAIVTLYLEICRTRCSKEQVNMVLDDCNFSIEHKTIIQQFFNEKNNEIMCKLGRIGSSFPHIIDADWRLDYNTKNNQTNKVMDLNYTIALKTDNPQSSEPEDDLTFKCNRNQLQDLVGKLKEAVKAVEKASQ